MTRETNPHRNSEPRPRPRPRRGAVVLVLAAALAMACASTAPPLATNLEDLVDESRNLEGLLNRYAYLEGNKRSQGGYTTFRAWFKPSGLVIVRAVTKDVDGNDHETHAYYRDGRPFYGVEWSQLQFEARTELQVFLDQSGAIIGSRNQSDGHLIPMSEGEPQGLARRLRVLKGDAEQARGPGHKINFDISELNDLGLIGPPLRAVRYGYCIPANEADAEKVTGIDRTAAIDRAGGAPCSADEWSATGSTHQAGYKKVLTELAGLSFVKRIRQLPAD